MNYFATSSTIPRTIWISPTYISTTPIGPDSPHDPVTRQSCRDADRCSDEWIAMQDAEIRRLRDRLGLSDDEDA